MLERLRRHFEPLFKFIAKYLYVNPNMLTLSSVLISIPSPLIVYFYNCRISILIVLILFIISSLLDAIDGAVARMYGLSSKKGAFLDSTCDRYVDSIMIITAILVCSDDISKIFLILTLVGSFITSYARARGESLGVQLRGIGFIERGERVILLIIFFIICYLIYRSNIFNIFTRYYTLILAILTNITAIQRIVTVCKILK